MQRLLLFAVVATALNSTVSDVDAQSAGGIARLRIVAETAADTAAVAEVPDDGPAIAEIPAPKPRAAARALVASPAGGFGSPSVRQQIDPNDNVERVLILTAGGPVVLRTEIFVDGQPFRSFREKLVDEMLQQADSDKDGKPTWEEAFRNPRFGFGRYSQIALQNEQQRKAIIGQFDQNKDGQVDRYEARQLIAQMSGAEFQVPSGSTIPQQPDVRRVLDTDGDGVISSAELAAAPERLKSRDANDNDLVEAAELGGTTEAQIQRSFGFNQVTPNGSVFPLGANVNYAAIRTALRQRYARDGKLVAESFPLFPRLLDGLDRNANGELDEAEVPQFNAIRPHVSAIVHLGQKEGVTRGIKVTWLCQEFEERIVVSQTPAERVTLSLPGVKLVLAAAAFEGRAYNYQQAAQSMLTQYDSDKNGYIEKKELDGQANKDYLVQQFDRWDENSDGKVFVEEIVADYDRQLAPQRSQVTLSAGDRGASLFAALDQSGDSRLSLREMRTAVARLKALDADGDGKLAPAEIPTEIVVTLSQGPSYGFQSSGAAVRPARSGLTLLGPSSKPVPKWFASMDRNGDGDLTIREFLGTAEQFKELDTNGDGFIEPGEARKANDAASR